MVPALVILSSLLWVIIEAQIGIPRKISDMLWKENKNNDYTDPKMIQFTQQNPYIYKTAYLQMPQFLTKKSEEPTSVFLQKVFTSDKESKSIVTPLNITKIHDNGLKNLDSVVLTTTETPLIDKHLKQEDLVKIKLVLLAKDTYNKLETQLEAVKKVHEKYKTNKMYQLGFVMCYLNKTKDGVTELMKYINKNKHKWNVLQILTAYEKLKKAKEFISQSLPAVPPPPVTLGSQAHPNEPRGGQGQIAWSYYDDNIA